MPYFLWKSLDSNRLLCHTDPYCMAYFGGIFFANMGGGGVVRIILQLLAAFRGGPSHPDHPLSVHHARACCRGGCGILASQGCPSELAGSGPIPKKSDLVNFLWAAANGGVTNGGLRGVWPPFLEIGRIGLFRPFSAFFALFRRVQRAPGKSRKRRKKAPFPQISSDLLKPPSLKPPFAALQFRGPD